MLDAAKEVMSFATNKTRRALDNDRMLTLSLVKSIEIIGEAESILMVSRVVPILIDMRSKEQ
jgi:uncharacterized protein with HEPN domain